MKKFRAALLGLALLGGTAASKASAGVFVGVSVGIAPPALPVYVQPAIPGPGFIWTPGYWAYADGDYYWVPGTWIRPPGIGLLWTPPWWGWSGGVYVFHGGYWGPHIGFYGGVNYGFGYIGTGYLGGYWAGGVFSYNRTVNNFGNVNITNVYNKTVVNNVTVNHVSYNGGTGGTTAAPTAQEQAAANERHVQPTRMQEQHSQMAAANPAMRNASNHGQPAVAATPRPGAFNAQAHTAAAQAHPAGHPQAPHPQAHPQAHPQHEHRAVQ